MSVDRSYDKAEWDFSSGENRDKLNEVKDSLSGKARAGYRMTENLNYDFLKHGDQLAYEIDRLEEQGKNVQGVHTYTHDTARIPLESNGRPCGILEADLEPKEAYIIDLTSEAVIIGDDDIVDKADEIIHSETSAE